MGDSDPNQGNKKKNSKRRPQNETRRLEKKLLNQEYHSANRNEFYTSIQAKPILYVQREELERKVEGGEASFYLDPETYTVISIIEMFRLSNWIDIKCVVPAQDLKSLLIPDFIYTSDLLNDVVELETVSCTLPFFTIPEKRETISGLSSCLRFFFKYCSAKLDEKNSKEPDALSAELANALKSLLGFRESCLQTCSEFSVWTKFCEDDIMRLVPDDLRIIATNYLQQHQLTDDDLVPIPLPTELLRFEYHLMQPVKKKNKMLRSSSTEHLFAEGDDITLADLIIYFQVAVCVGLFHEWAFKKHLPMTLAWIRRVEALLPETGRRPGVLPSIYVDMALCVYGFPPLQLPPKESLYKSDPLRASSSVKNYTKQSDVDAAMAVFGSLTMKSEGFCAADALILDPLCDWSKVPEMANPGKGGNLPEKRQMRKNHQVANMLQMIGFVYKKKLEHRKASGNNSAVRVVDFCSGSGHVGIAFAWMFPESEVVLVENKEESLRIAEKRVSTLGLKNVSIFQCNLTSFIGDFDIGCALHACGSSTDLVLRKCRERGASFVVSPCCYGKIEWFNQIKYPQSSEFLRAGESHELDGAKDYFKILTHVAEQTQNDQNTTAVKHLQGIRAMKIIDTDRCNKMEEQSPPGRKYHTWLKLMVPPTASPKNHILVGYFAENKIRRPGSSGRDVGGETHTMD